MSPFPSLLISSRSYVKPNKVVTWSHSWALHPPHCAMPWHAVPPCQGWQVLGNLWDTMAIAVHVGSGSETHAPVGGLAVRHPRDISACLVPTQCCSWGPGWQQHPCSPVWWHTRCVQEQWHRLCTLHCWLTEVSRNAGTLLWGSLILSGDITSFPEQFFDLSFHKVYWFMVFSHYLIIRTQIARLYMANQKSSITAVDGFGDMQVFSYNCVSHHNIFKSYFSWCSHQYCKARFALCVVWRRTSICMKKILSKQDFVLCFQSLKITNPTQGIYCTVLCHSHEWQTWGDRTH